eukprot:CAMPEP_0174334592 /NCGR_PEP_ID=MMETSP0810-20121108/20042_1 /TAXON_ID=73025 ORGANISM="Eutreptiella gymnastica-like, Strain CCMP1594" /NCGR_SAMPLE_ID=MMETSP0810 /ASSEMBLY_ACC=CAM_ASM_000659 /LENGTH=125 /DNA_ID=CAMNT_0015452335 /DNA_START=26 /DNA_END=403 /DNA_ORIENTATION=+
MSLLKLLACLALVTVSTGCICDVISYNIGNCSTDIAAKIQWVYPPGECVTDGAISRMAVSCEEIYDYPSLDCTGTPIVNFTGKGECVGIYGVTSMAMNCTPGAGVSVVVNWLLVVAGLLLWQAFV